MANSNWKSSRIIKKNAHVDRIFIKEETRAHIKKVSAILKKAEAVRTEDEWKLLQESEDVVRVIRKRTQVKEQTLKRLLEIEDSPELLQDKCEKLASVIRNATSLVVYTGAGISTAASIPDYRGPNGVWTLLKQGKQLRSMDLCDAEPTLTHMAIVELYKRGLVKHIVSQNCDGLHLRSDLPRSALSELHGNMYIEMCWECQPPVDYVRLFDVTERTAMRRHKTGRRCHKCSSALFDTIVHFGEKGAHESPYNWCQAVEAAESADIILCLGSSLKVLKKYACLWGMHRPVAKRPRLFIVNLQWTPKDTVAALKINGRCDHVMHLVMKHLGIDIPSYYKSADPIFALAVPLRANEVKTTIKKMLSGSCSSARFSQGHSEGGKRGNDRRFKKQLSSLPTRVMPPRRAKSSARRTVRTPKQPSTSCAPTSKDAESIHDCSGDCQSCSFVLSHLVKSDNAGTGVTEWSDIEKSEDRSSETSQKCFYGCISSNSISRVKECLSQSIMDGPLNGSDATVASMQMLAGSRLISHRDFEGGQLLHVMDGKCDLDRMTGNGTCWWDRIDSKMWLEALQAYLLHMNGERMNADDGNSYTTEYNFSANNDLADVPPYGTGFRLSRDDLISGSVSRQNMVASFGEASKEPSSADVLCVQVPVDQWQKVLDSGEALKRHLNQKCVYDHLRELLTVADSKVPVSEMPVLQSTLKCSDEWLSARPLKRESQSDMLPCETKVCIGTGYGEQALKLCTLSDLKMMHNLLFDSKSQSKDLPTRNTYEESRCSAETVTLPVESMPFNSANLELNMMDVNANAKNPMANADLVRFMHSYCQQGISAKQEPRSPSKAADMPLLSRSPSVYNVPVVSGVDFVQEIIQSNKGAEQIRTDQINGNSQRVTGATTSSPADGKYLSTACDCIAQLHQRCDACMSSASLDSASQSFSSCDDLVTVVGLDSCQDIGRSSLCVSQSRGNCCDMPSSNANANSHMKEQKVKQGSVSTPGWFGKGISLRKLKRKSLK